MHVIFSAFAALASTLSLGALAAEPVPREGVWIIEEYIAADSDGDGVKDAADACPQSLIGAIVNKQGCAKGGVIAWLSKPTKPSSKSRDCARSVIYCNKNVILFSGPASGAQSPLLLAYWLREWYNLHNRKRGFT